MIKQSIEEAKENIEIALKQLEFAIRLTNLEIKPEDFNSEVYNQMKS